MLKVGGEGKILDLGCGDAVVALDLYSPRLDLEKEFTLSLASFRYLPGHAPHLCRGKELSKMDYEEDRLFFLTNEGYYTCLGSNLPWMEYYFGEKLYLPNPYLRNPANFRSGTSFIKQVKDYSYQKSIDIGVKNFSINQSLVFLEEITDGVEGYGFASHLPTNTFKSLCINEMPLLKLFVKKFREEFDPLFCKMSEELVDIAALIGPTFYANDSNIQTSTIDRKSFLKKFHLAQILELSSREKEVLFLVSKGLFAVQIADHLELSKRTVEHYIENIKNKLNCFSKSELIQKANEFLSIGYPLP